MTGKRSKHQAEPASDRGSVPSELELFIFRELPGELRYLLTVSAELPEVVIYAANAVNSVLQEVSGDSPPAVLQRSAMQLRSHADQIHRAASDLQVLAGRLQGLAWAGWAGEQSQLKESFELPSKV
jgi:hypothetical protein